MTQEKHTPGPYIIVPPGGPAGPFWGIVSQVGTAVAMQIFSEADALAIVEGLAHVNTPRPEADWSQAPEWAMWWAVEANGDAFWYQYEPSIEKVYVIQHSWTCRKGKVNAIEERVSIPLGIDWRLLKERRPVAP